MGLEIPSDPTRPPEMPLSVGEDATAVVAGRDFVRPCNGTRPISSASKKCPAFSFLFSLWTEEERSRWKERTSEGGPTNKGRPSFHIIMKANRMDSISSSKPVRSNKAVQWVKHPIGFQSASSTFWSASTLIECWLCLYGRQRAGRGAFKRTSTQTEQMLGKVS